MRIVKNIVWPKESIKLCMYHLAQVRKLWPEYAIKASYVLKIFECVCMCVFVVCVLYVCVYACIFVSLISASAFVYVRCCVY